MADVISTPSRVVVFLAALLVVLSCAKPTPPREEGDLYVSDLNGVEQRLTLKPDGTYVLRNPTSEVGKGTYTREGQTLTIFGSTGVRAVLKLEGDGFVDNGGIKWTKR